MDKTQQYCNKILLCCILFSVLLSESYRYLNYTVDDSTRSKGHCCHWLLPVLTESCQCTIWYLSNVSDFADVPLNLEQSHHLQKYAGRLFILISSSIETAFDQTATDLWFAITCIAFCKSWKSLKRGLCELENLSRKCIHSSNQSDHEC